MLAAHTAQALESLALKAKGTDKLHGTVTAPSVTAQQCGAYEEINNDGQNLVNFSPAGPRRG